MSVLEIEKVNKNATYTCKADNGLGHDYKQIEVETVKTTYFDVIEVPKGNVVLRNILSFFVFTKCCMVIVETLK